MKKSKEKNKLKFKDITNFFSVIFIAVILLWCFNGYTEASNVISFAQVSDVHYSSTDMNTSYKLTAESGEVFKDVVAQINEYRPKLDFVMFTGDMVNKPLRKELKEFLTIAQDINSPWYVAFGNHDVCIGGALTKKLYFETVGEYNSKFKFRNSYYSFVPKKGFKVIVLDSIIDDHLSSNGRISEKQMQWLDEELKKTKKSDVILVFLHVPVIEPFPSSSHKLLNGDELFEHLSRSSNPIGVFTGHYHMTKVIQKGNILFVNTPSLVSYPNAFRIIKVKNNQQDAVFELRFKETRYKDVQRRAKMLTFGSGRYYGLEKDRNASYVIEKK